MKSLMKPKSIAIIGASEEKGSVGNVLAERIKNFKGMYFYVNKKHDKILGSKSYNSILDISSEIDLAVVAIPARFVLDVVRQCVSKKVKSMIIISAGFSEAGNSELEKEIMKIKGNMNILGPNCFGIVNNFLNLDLTFAKSNSGKSKIGFISQSGALWSAVAEKYDVGYFISLGNMMDIGFNEALEFMINDGNIESIVLYIESLKEGRKFIDICKKSPKRIIVIKSGESESGKKAALSHTGSMAGNSEIYNAAFRQARVSIAKSLTEAFDKARFGFKPGKILIVTNAGGPGTLVADYLDGHLMKFNQKFSFGKSGNPVDVIGDATSSRFREVFEKVKGYDTLVVIVTPQIMTDMDAIAKEVVKVKKNVVCVWMSPDGLDILKKNNIPVFFEPKRMAEFLIF